ncbi:hypothetical protein MFERI13461_00178 [Mycoplasma feriruminatoris]|nr:hypothetical protein MFERI13461_00178 [Mycoplasma feriruminatoris]
MNYKDKWLDKMIKSTDKAIYHNMDINCNNYIDTFIKNFKGLTKFTIREDYKLNKKTEQEAPRYLKHGLKIFNIITGLFSELYRRQSF